MAGAFSQWVPTNNHPGLGGLTQTPRLLLCMLMYKAGDTGLTGDAFALGVAPSVSPQPLPLVPQRHATVFQPPGFLL